MSFFKKAKIFFAEYWEIFLALIAVLAGIVIGTSGKREKVLQVDSSARKKASEEIRLGTDNAIKDYHDARKEVLDDKINREAEADQKEDDRKKEILNNSSKLDKILKDRYNLKRG